MSGQVLTVALNAAVDTTYLLDGFRVGGIHTAAQVSRVAGGKANNVARVLQALAVPVLATGLAGGQAGSFVQAQLRALGIAADYEPIAGDTRTCLAIVDRTGHTLTELREPGPTVTPVELDSFCARYRRLLGAAATMVCSGSLPPGVPTATYGRLIGWARAAGACALLDAGGAALAAALPAGPDLVKPNREELATWAGHALPDLGAVRAAATALLRAGARAAAVSLGAEGLLYLGPEGAWRIQPPRVTVVNTVGSGDSLVAGYVAGRWRRLATVEVLRLAVACGTANALTSAVAAPAPAEIERILPQGRVTEA